ncbi:MAG: hypothetical protein HY901_09480 [Deltaproteobacteria bacterium]|nr:hypothetical protein [Deltaproteobacteria bacterium]
MTNATRIQLLAGLVALLAGGAGCSEDKSKNGEPDAGPSAVVINPAVRACDLLLDTGVAAVGSVVFGEGVIGRYKRDGSRLAVSFTSRTDAAPASRPTLLDASGQPLDPSTLTVNAVQCYDRLGAPVADPGLTLH